MIRNIGIKRKLIILYLVLSVIGLYAEPRIQFKSTEVDFGKMGQNETKIQTLVFKNVGNENLEVKTVRSSCGCTVGELKIKDKLVLPRGTGEIKVTFESRRYIGGVIKNLYVRTNDPKNPRVQIKVKATVKVQPSSSPVLIEYFYSEDCEECSFVKEKILKILKEKYNLKIRSFEVSDPSNYEYLVSIEEKHEDINNEIPAIVIEKYILGGVDEIEDFLEDRILEYQKAGIEAKVLGKDDFDTLKLSDKVQMVYFFDAKSRACERVKYELSFLEKKYFNFSVSRYDITSIENKELNEAFCEFYNVPESKRLTTPMLFIGEDYLTSEDLQKVNLREVLYKYKDKGAKVPWAEIFEIKDKAGKKIKERFEKVGIFTILSAGLIDGINPCAFATIIFLIAFLSAIGKKNKETLLIGITYSAVVFLMYFFIGLGLIKVIGVLRITNIIEKIILAIIALLSISFGVLSFYDYIKIKKGKTGEAKLQLPRFIKKRIHAVIREKMGMRNLFIAAIVSGFFISLSEFICTGQIYLPTLMFVSNVPSLRIRALFYLFLYNIAFVFPLIVVFFSTYKGMRSSVLNKFWSKKVEFVKLISGIFFVFLGGLLIFYIFFF